MVIIIMKKFTPFVPFLLILTVLSSGCTVPFLNIEIPGLPDIPGLGGPTVIQYEHDIVIIKSLEAVPAEIDAGQTTKLIAYVQNIGDRNVGRTDETPSGKVEIELYDYCKGLFSPEVSICSGTPDNTAGGTKCTIDTLLPGETTRVVWTLKQEGVVNLKTICPPDGMKVSVGYQYTTSSLTTISFISKEELERTLEDRVLKSTESYIVIGQGPIKPYLTVEDKQPIPVYEGARTVLQLQLKNLGSGDLDTEVTKTVNGNQVKVIGLYGENIKVEGVGSGSSTGTELKVATAGGKIENCKFKDSGWDKEIVRLIGRESSPYLCKIDLSDLEDDVIKTATRHLRVSVLYDYLFTKEAFVTVNPKISG
jgi:hypothetical protein